MSVITCVMTCKYNYNLVNNNKRPHPHWDAAVYIQIEIFYLFSKIILLPEFLLQELPLQQQEHQP